MTQTDWVIKLREANQKEKESHCPFIVMEVRKGIPSHLAKENEELSYCLSEAWDNHRISHTYEGAAWYIKTMETDDKRIWIERR